jgi:YD repeat-containing protein
MRYLIPCLFGVFAIAPMSLMQARPVNLEAPSGALGSSDPMGFVETWEEVQDIDFGGDLTLPFRFGFTSKPERTSSFFGNGWIIPLWDARAVMVDETSMRAELPCGKVMYLHCTPNDPTHFHTQNGAWQAILNPEAHTFSVTRDDGWLLKYENGRLAELKTDTGRDILWNYIGDQFSFLEEGGKRPLEVTTDINGQPNGFVVNGQTYGFTLDRRPVVQDSPAGRVIGELAPTLGSFTWPDGKSDRFQFKFTSTMDASLEITDRAGQKSHFTWAPQGHILSDNNWKYTVGEILPDSNLPALSRTNPAGQTEGIRIATKAGVITETNLQGVVTTTKIFRTPGPYFNRVREISQTVNGMTRLLQRRNYDEVGRLIRSMDESGTITSYAYDAKGKLVSESAEMDATLSAQMRKREEEMLNKIAAAPKCDKEDLLYKLGLFYMQQMHDYNKAGQLALTMSQPSDAYIVSLFAVAYNPQLNDGQKVVEYQKLLVRYPEKRDFITGIINKTMDTISREHK